MDGNAFVDFEGEENCTFCWQRHRRDFDAGEETLEVPHDEIEEVNRQSNRRPNPRLKMSEKFIIPDRPELGLRFSFRRWTSASPCRTFWETSLRATFSAASWGRISAESLSRCLAAWWCCWEVEKSGKWMSWCDGPEIIATSLDGNTSSRRTAETDGGRPNSCCRRTPAFGVLRRSKLWLSMRSLSNRKIQLVSRTLNEKHSGKND